MIARVASTDIDVELAPETCVLCPDCMRCFRPDHQGLVAHMVCRCAPGEAVAEVSRQ